MIVVRISDGLGNQMFQYALGRRLSRERGVALKLDPRAVKGHPERHFALDELSLESAFATKDEVRALTRLPTLVPKKLAPRFLRERRRRLRPPTYRREGDSFRFEPDVLSTPAPAYLHGYWQSERYFDSIADVLREDFEVRTPITGRDAQVAAQIDDVEAVSIHVRRGDYVSDPATHALHGVCSADYYAQGVAYFTEHLSAPRFFVFSDDPAWAAANLKLPSDTVFIDHNDGSNGHEDLRLMSRCRHHLIANSSFSWWGAWLNPRPDKIVVAPRRWTTAFECPDVCPPAWVRL